MQTIILANGAFPKSEKLIQLLRNAGQIICCDGAVNKLLEINVEPSLIIGDLDSVKASVKDKYDDRILQIDNQNNNDLTKAVNWCIGQGINKLTILGATGEREDHSIGNIALLTDYARDADVRMLTDYGVFIPVLKQEFEFETFPGQQVSLFSLNPKTRFFSEGLKYPLTGLQLSSWWMGTLNEAVGTGVHLRIEGEAKAIVYLLDAK